MKKLIILIYFCSVLLSCGQSNKNIKYFKEPQVFLLAKAVVESDLEQIKKQVEGNPNLLEETSERGSNVLMLSIQEEKYESFKLLLELGSNPNAVNKIDKNSVLMSACRYFGNSFEWRKDFRYAEELLKRGADPNYTGVFS